MKVLANLITDIGAIEVGRVLYISFPSPYNKKKGSSEKIPAVVFKKSPEPDGFPMYSVFLFSKYNTGNRSGAIEIDKLAVWRYAQEEIPEKFLQELKDWSGESRYLVDKMVPLSKVHVYRNGEKVYLSQL